MLQAPYSSLPTSRRWRRRRWAGSFLLVYMLVYYLWSVVFEQIFFGHVPPLPYICVHFRCEWCHHRLLHCGGCRMKPNKISFSPSCFFCSARPHLIIVLCFLGPAWLCSAISSSFLFSLLSLASRFLPEYACFSFYFS